MYRPNSLLLLIVTVVLLTMGCENVPADTARPPNIILILADDLGYGDVGVFGQERIETPTLDRMAAEGIRFTQFYAGATVCAPSRSVLMTGLHNGHTRVRGNAGPQIQTLLPEDATIAELLKERGYATALIGKWGLGDEGNTGRPNDQGFDYFFGYLNQVHAHNFYPEFLWRNEERVPLPNVVERADAGYGGFTGGVATEKVAYSHDLFVDEAAGYIRSHAEEPFFLFLALTIPHANNEADRVDWAHGMEVPDYDRYADTDWPEEQKGLAAMITRMDSGIGTVLDELTASGIDDRTIVIFSSDNGPHAEGGNDPDFFDSNGPLRGIKRDLYEGGIRVPTIAWGPEIVPGGLVSDHIGYFGDFMITFADLAGLPEPVAHDGVTLVPVLTGNEEVQPAHDYLYWEFYERGSAQAVRMGKWKGVRVPMFEGELELYDLETDIGEEDNVAADHPDVVEEILQIMEDAHVPDSNWVPNWTPPTPE